MEFSLNINEFLAVLIFMAAYGHPIQKNQTK
jgi:hypothetical protein